MSTLVPAEILSIWNSGSKVLAIKLLREQSGLGLAEAKQLLESANAGAADSPLAMNSAIPANAELRIHAAMASGNKLEAVKLLKEATGLGLAEAKERIDEAMQGEPLNLEAALHQPTPRNAASSAPGEVKSSHGTLWLALILVALAWGAWFYFKAA
ncbi:MAG: hypothetical protein RSE32_10360 [Comamonas sp.]|uniref:hypothetical protein n=1 Tax=Comamonas sp. TaxID=34028 RepID=UPI002FCA4409